MGMGSGIPIPAGSGMGIPRLELKMEMQAHGLKWEKTCCSKMFEGKNCDRGAVIARSNPNIKSSCWIRTMIRVNGSWVVEPCADYWKLLSRPAVCHEVLPQLSYVDTLPPEVQYLGFLNIENRAPKTDLLPPLDMLTSSLLIPDLVSAPADTDSISSSHDLMDFHVSSPMDEEFVETSADGTAPDPTQISLPPPVNQLSLPVATNVSASFVELRASISRLVANHTRDSRNLGEGGSSRPQSPPDDQSRPSGGSSSRSSGGSGGSKRKDDRCSGLKKRHSSGGSGGGSYGPWTLQKGC
ncbi:hypothetical protein F511_17031 [Dorcoceras hygrometricum]|uniref:Uncharacterized protein n=1 Tax=Dorcoceras hygrometricum TaxID=472368 RepID=A0A2Z7CJY4_9LAMI|nr:hypothetical protein F511_17031 [Dorcoceras hygrometricum]